MSASSPPLPYNGTKSHSGLLCSNWPKQTNKQTKKTTQQQTTQQISLSSIHDPFTQDNPQTLSLRNNFSPYHRAEESMHLLKDEYLTLVMAWHVNIDRKETLLFFQNRLFGALSTTSRAASFHYIRQKADILTANISKIMQLIPKQSGWINCFYMHYM